MPGFRRFWPCISGRKKSRRKSGAAYSPEARAETGPVRATVELSSPPPTPPERTAGRSSFDPLQHIEHCKATDGKEQTLKTQSKPQNHTWQEI